MPFLLLQPILAQTEGSSEDGYSLRDVRALRRQVERNAGLEAGLRDQILGLYDEAVGALQSAEQYRSQTALYQADGVGIEPELATLRSQVAQPLREHQLTLPENATAEWVEGRLARELSLLSHYRLELRVVNNRGKSASTARVT